MKRTSADILFLKLRDFIFLLCFFVPPPFKWKRVLDVVPLGASDEISCSSTRNPRRPLVDALLECVID